MKKNISKIYLAASSFLIQYKDAIIITGLLANVAGSIYIARANIKTGRSSKKWKKSQSNGG